MLDQDGRVWDLDSGKTDHAGWRSRYTADMPRPHVCACRACREYGSERQSSTGRRNDNIFVNHTVPALAKYSIGRNLSHNYLNLYLSFVSKYDKILPTIINKLKKYNVIS